MFPSPEYLSRPWPGNLLPFASERCHSMRKGKASARLDAGRRFASARALLIDRYPAGSPHRAL
jgi:hypothetical protein